MRVAGQSAKISRACGGTTGNASNKLLNMWNIGGLNNGLDLLTCRFLDNDDVAVRDIELSHRK